LRNQKLPYRPARLAAIQFQHSFGPRLSTFFQNRIKVFWLIILSSKQNRPLGVCPNVLADGFAKGPENVFYSHLIYRATFVC
jgi:hypothetical protein